eukprot:TRINITY_DN55120_c0_g1_i2.p1 TRINITY_DN55120_c0_g1~~TRINITY_DN55120_c0_g1_i2.p1  ORF type:complete len:329 (-),score=74.10 TRINITY_DN55120_c0_g1_i2:119-1105(-)
MYLTLRLLRSFGCRFSVPGIFFTVVTCTAMVDLVLALGMADCTQLGRFYLHTGEEYFKTGWGFWTLLWDGTAHYCLQAFLAYVFLTGRSAELIGLVWSGSIINSMPVLLLGAAVGGFSEDIKPSTALNAPYVLVPILFLWRVLTKPSESQVAKPHSVFELKSSPCALIARMLLLIFHNLAILVHVFRAMAVLGSKARIAVDFAELDPLLGWVDDGSHGFIKVQLVQSFFYFIPFHALALSHLIAPNSLVHQVSMSRWALVFVGAYLQAEVTHIGASGMRWDDFGVFHLRWDQLGPTFWCIHLGLVGGSVLFAAWTAAIGRSTEQDGSA